MNNLMDSYMKERQPPTFEKAMSGWEDYYRSKKDAMDDYKELYCKRESILHCNDPMYALVSDVDYFFARLSLTETKDIQVRKLLNRYKSILAKVLKNLSIEGVEDF